MRLCSASPLLSGSGREQLLRQLWELLEGGWQPKLQQLSPPLCAGPVALYLADCDLARARQLWATVERHLGAGESPSAALPLLHAYRHALAAVSARGLLYLQVRPPNSTRSDGHVPDSDTLVVASFLLAMKFLKR